MIVSGLRENQEEICVSSYRQPNLERFIFSGIVLSEYSIGLLESRCPRLKAINVHPCDSINSDRLLRFLDTCGSLTNIHINWHTNNSIYDRDLAHIAGRDGLLGFGTQNAIKTKTIGTVFETHKSIQAHHTVDVKLQSKAVAPLTTAITSAAKLSLEILDNNVRVLPAIGCLSGLIELEIIF